jgi:MYXO-CTERM domain-containing protein
MVVVLALLLSHSVAHAALFTVKNANDSGPDSFRQALIDANMSPGPHTIIFSLSAPGPATVTLASPLPSVIVALTVTGLGADQLTIQGSGASPVLTLSAGVQLQLSGVTIKGAVNSAGNGGGIAVTVADGTLILLDSVVTGNSASSGSGIFSMGTLTIRRSSITGNTGTGTSAIFGGGNTTVVDSTIADNTGTGIVFPTAGKTLSIDRCTISGNTAASGSGGVELQAGTASIRNTTLSGNSFSGSSATQAGNLSAVSGVTLALVNVTAAGGSAPALVFESGSTVTLRNTLVAGTTANCSSDSHPTSQGHNLSSDATCNLTDATDQSSKDPLLGPLMANGGATLTHALMARSPALNAGDGLGLETSDQRGKMRVQFLVVDIGAVEVSEPVLSTQPVAPQAVAEGDPFTLSVAAMNQNSTTPLTYQWRKDGTAVMGATSATYTNPAAAVADAGMYDVLVINDGGGLPSAAVAVTVTPAVKGDVTTGGDGGSGGCCSSTGGGSSSALLGLVLVVVLGVPRRRRR